MSKLFVLTRIFRKPHDCSFIINKRNCEWFLAAVLLGSGLLSTSVMATATTSPSDNKPAATDTQDSPPPPSPASPPKKGKFDYPTSLDEFNYYFNTEGQLRDKDTEKGFVFQIKDDHSYNQRRYENLGEVITDYVYNLLEEEAHLEKVYIPKDAEEEEPRSFFFMSKDALTNPDKLLLLIHGSGVVRAGQWARRLIINDCLDSGTQLPYIKKAVQDGYGVIVLNTNLNRVKIDGKSKAIKGSSSPEVHGQYVWDHFVSEAKAKHIAIVAHSYGGVVTTDLAAGNIEAFRERVFAIAFTDSVHSLAYQRASRELSMFYKNKARNWVASDEPLDTALHTSRADCPRFSAGHNTHENTSWSCFTSVFKFFKDQYPKSDNDNEEL